MYILLALLCLTACSPTAGVPASTQVSISAASHPRVEAISANRADLAELERRGGFASGMGLKEAELSLEDGDGSSYVLALYKEFLYERDYGSPANEWSELRSLADALPQLGFTEPELKRALDVLTVLGYIEAGNWDLAGSLLPDAKPDEPDGMLSWLGALCRLYGQGSPEAQSRYGALQTRYRNLPSYWYHAAMNSGRIELQRDAATRCVLLSPGGPLALKARVVLARSYGLGPEDASSLLLAQETQAVVTQALESGMLSRLAELFPVLSLPDNPETLYALGALKALAADSSVLAWLKEQLAGASGRLAERLVYVNG